ncbi:sulfotransferase [unidentified eubacterium SCB49]|nr:sulfotransferase [unidentified eubacterium SCB49]
MLNNNTLDRPIFIVGHARGGSTLLGAIVNTHSKVGPNYLKNVDITSLKDYKYHFEFSEKLEQKDIWFKYFKGKECFTHIGKEMLESNLKLSDDEVDSLVRDLLVDFKEERFLSKSPTNVFRINPILEIFPNCKVLIILRNGEEVVASWGNRSYGFGKRVNWGNVKIKKLGYLQGINIFIKKWYDVINAVEEFIGKPNVMITSYDNLIENTDQSINKIFEFLELPYEPYLNDIKIKKETDKWKLTIPKYLHFYIKARAYYGNKKIAKMTRWIIKAKRIST